MKAMGFICLLGICAGRACAENNGSYVGRVVVVWNLDGRNMTLLEPFAYIDPAGTRWDAPVGSVTDGASIPKVAWSIIGGPFEGPYRFAAVIHDVACTERKRKWQDVDLAFYTAMLASGVDHAKAKVMYGAVYHFGPRWNTQLTFRDLKFSEANAMAAQFTANMTKGAFASAQVIPGPTIKQHCEHCAEPLPDLPPATADLSVMLTPRAPTLSEADFPKLKDAIETRDLSLAEIEDFVPGKGDEPGGKP